MLYYKKVELTENVIWKFFTPLRKAVKLMKPELTQFEDRYQKWMNTQRPTGESTTLPRCARSPKVQWWSWELVSKKLSDIEHRDLQSSASSLITARISSYLLDHLKDMNEIRFKYRGMWRNDIRKLSCLFYCTVKLLSSDYSSIVRYRKWRFVDKTKLN